MQHDPTDLLTAAELAVRLKVRTRTIDRWARTGRIPVRRLSPKVRRFVVTEVVASLESDAGSKEAAR